MPCLSPLLIRNPYYYNKKNGHLRYKDEMECYDRTLRPLKIEVPCGKCLGCAKTHRGFWRTRLLAEMKDHKDVFFVSLTLSPENYDKYVTDLKRPIRLFLERYRKKYKKSLRHFIVTEKGEKNGRDHYHALIFSPKCSHAEFRHFWDFGHVWIDRASSKTASYIVKYLVKDYNNPDYKAKIFTSPGIGKSYLNATNISYHRLLLSDGTFNSLIRYSTHSAALPRYYALKIYSEEERLAVSHILAEKPFERTFKNKKYTDVTSYRSALAEELKRVERLGFLKRKKHNFNDYNSWHF